jgi:predicted DNA-binding transcriptional regulator YafY
MPLSEEQLKQIQSALDVLGHYEGLPQFESLENNLNDMKLKFLDVSRKPCISFEHNEYLEGREHLKDLFNAIQYETALLITYKSFDRDEERFIFHPNHLKQYNNRRYILGVSEYAPGQIWNLALDRIKRVELSQVEYQKLDVDWNDYFSDVMGVTNDVNSPVEEVQFLVHGRSGHYFVTKPIHETQHSKWLDDNTLLIKISVKINYELRRFLLSYAHDITILSPQSLVEDHKEKLRIALGRY